MKRKKEQLLPDGFVIACGIVAIAGSGIMLAICFIIEVIANSVLER